MALEVYRSEMLTRWRSKLNYTTFFFSVDNTTNVHPHRVSADINFEYAIASLWLSRLLGMVTIEAVFTGLRTNRIRPITGPFAWGMPVGPAPTGQWLGPVGDNFQTANIHWTFAGDTTGKHQVRIGPLGEGAFREHDWFFTFKLAAGLFITEHLTPHTLSTGLESRACINHQSSGGTLIEAAQLKFPPGRQSNRRVKL